MLFFHAQIVRIEGNSGALVPAHRLHLRCSAQKRRSREARSHMGTGIEVLTSPSFRENRFLSLRFRWQILGRLHGVCSAATVDPAGRGIKHIVTAIEIQPLLRDGYARQSLTRTLCVDWTKCPGLVRGAIWCDPDRLCLIMRGRIITRLVALNHRAIMVRPFCCSRKAPMCGT